MNLAVSLSSRPVVGPVFPHQRKLMMTQQPIAFGQASIDTAEERQAKQKKRRNSTLRGIISTLLLWAGAVQYGDTKYGPWLSGLLILVLHLLPGKKMVEGLRDKSMRIALENQQTEATTPEGFARLTVANILAPLLGGYVDIEKIDRDSYRLFPRYPGASILVNVLEISDTEEYINQQIQKNPLWQKQVNKVELTPSDDQKSCIIRYIRPEEYVPSVKEEETTLTWKDWQKTPKQSFKRKWADSKAFMFRWYPKLSRRLWKNKPER